MDTIATLLIKNVEKIHRNSNYDNENPGLARLLMKMCWICMHKQIKKPKSAFGPEIQSAKCVQQVARKETFDSAIIAGRVVTPNTML